VWSLIATVIAFAASVARANVDRFSPASQTRQTGHLADDRVRLYYVQLVGKVSRPLRQVAGRIRQLLRMRLFHVGNAVPDDPP
jgi:hypothetical protein